MFTRVDYRSSYDGFPDWYLYRPGTGGFGVVVLHGHGSAGDQLVTRADLVREWLPALDCCGAGVAAPNLRGNAWMSEGAAADLAQLLRDCRERSGWKRVFIVSGSMGGTGALIFAMLHPELIDGLGVLGAATDIGRYRAWCATRPEPILREIHDAIARAYPTKELQERHNVCRHAGRLAMPVLLYHGGADAIIPVSEARALAECLAGKPGFRYHEIVNGNHDAPLPFFGEALEALWREP